MSNLKINDFVKCSGHPNWGEGIVRHVRWRTDELQEVTVAFQFVGDKILIAVPGLLERINVNPNVMCRCFDQSVFTCPRHMQSIR